MYVLWLTNQVMIILTIYSVYIYSGRSECFWTPSSFQAVLIELMDFNSLLFKALRGGNQFNSCAF